MTVMKSDCRRTPGQSTGGKPRRRAAALIAALALASLLGGCVVYPASPGYYYHPYHWHDRDGRDWR